MISKTKIGKRIERKTDPRIVETILLAKKNGPWQMVAQLISSSRRNYSSVNLKDIEKQTSEGDTVIVPGKVMGSGRMSKKIRVCAINFSESAREKLKDSKSEVIFLIDEIKKNPKAEGVKILR